MSGAAWREGITTWIFDIVIPIPSEFINSAFTLLPEAPINGGLQGSLGAFSAGACNDHLGRGGILTPPPADIRESRRAQSSNCDRGPLFPTANFVLRLRHRVIQ
jgi:hypothetical protein